MNLIIFGAPGSGKGTQSKILSEKLKLEHVSTGQVFRDYFSHSNSFKGYTREQYEQGILARNSVVNGLIEKILPKNNFILDGYPRTLKQAEFLDDIAVINKVIYLECPFPILKERMLKRGRPDDNEKAVKTRFESYLEKTLPLIRYYGKKVLHINGNSSQKKVSGFILESLRKRLS